MRRFHLLLPSLILTACSEYGWSGPADETVETHEVTPPPEDTAAEIDCDFDEEITVTVLPWEVETPHPFPATDVDAQGRMVGVLGIDRVIARDDSGVVHFVTEPVTMTWWPRVLPDGRYAYLQGGQEDGGLVVVEPASGEEVARVPMPYQLPYGFVPLDGGTVFLWWLEPGRYTIAEIDPYAGWISKVRELDRYIEQPTGCGPSGLATSPTGDRLYAAGCRTSDWAEQSFVIEEYRRQGPSRWSSPTTLLSSTDPEFMQLVSDMGTHKVWRTSGIATDRCGNIYVAGKSGLWRLSPAGDGLERIAEWPPMKYITRYTFWGSGGGSTDVGTLYVVGYDEDYQWTRYAVHLGVDGGHVLAR